MAKSPARTDPVAAAVIFLVILLIAAAVLMRLWANDARLAVPAIEAMATAPDGNVYVVVGNDLFIERASGELEERVPLSRWGVNDYHGDLAVLSDGSVILAQGRLGKVDAREARRIMARARSVIDPTEPLMRCHRDGDACTVLSGDGEGVQLGRAFGMDVDETSGHLYVAEPAKHRLLQISLDGRQLAVSGKGWKFPNSARVIDGGRVGFADTNNYRYVEIAAGADGFGAITEDVSTNDWPGIVPLTRFPSEALKDANGTLWILIARGDMADATLYRRPANGLPQLIALPEDADPIALVEAGGNLLVADVRNFRIHRFSLSGELREDFGSAALKDALAEYKQRHDRYDLLVRYGLYAVLLVAIPALIFGFRLQKRAEAASTPRDEEVAGGEDVEIALTSLQAQYAKLRGEYIFWRKYSALGTDAERVFLFMALLPIAALAGLGYVLAPSAPDDAGAIDTRTALLLGAVALAFVFMWCSSMFERVVISREGIRYTSPFPRPLSFLVLPAWSLRWEDIESVRLRTQGHGRYPTLWWYEIVARDGRKRRIQPFSWRLAGEKEVGVPFKALLRLTPDVIRDAVHRTRLYQLIAAARKRPDRDAGGSLADEHTSVGMNRGR